MHRSIALLVTSLMTGACASSGSDRDDFTGRDDVFSRGVRVQLEMQSDRVPSDDAPTAGTPARGEASSTVFFEAGFDRGYGDFSQRLDSGRSVRLDTVTINGPADVAVAFDLTRVYFGVRAAKPERNGITVSALFGLTLTELEVEARAGLLHESDRKTGFGFLFGVGAAIELRPSFDAFVDFSVAPQLAEGWDSVSLITLDLGLAADLANGCTLAAGWRHWRYAYSVGDDGGFFFGSPDSDVDLRLSGPFVTLQLGN